MKGIYTALITPFCRDGAIDWDAFDRLLRQQADQGVDGIVICGTTGESPTLSKDEKIALMKRALDRLRNTAVDLVAGTGSNATEDTVSFTKEVEDLGYGKFLIVTPYYNKPNQRGMIEHFTKVADAIRGEIILYNVPGRTGVGLTAKTVATLAGHPRIQALKEASGNLAFLDEIRSELKAQNRSLDLLSGDDETYLEFLKRGGVGSISVASHLLGSQMKEMANALESGDLARADALNEQCMPLFKDLFIDTNPAPLKFCLREGGLIEEVLRLPLVPMTEEARATLRRDLSAWKWENGALH